VHLTFHRERAEFPENVRNSLHEKGVGSPGRIRTSNISVNSLVLDLITIVPEPRQIDGNQQVLAKWAVASKIGWMVINLRNCPIKQQFS